MSFDVSIGCSSGGQFTPKASNAAADGAEAGGMATMTLEEVAFDREGLEAALNSIDVGGEDSIRYMWWYVAWGSHAGARMLAAQCEMWYIEARKATASSKAAFFERVVTMAFLTGQPRWKIVARPVDSS